MAKRTPEPEFKLELDLDYIVTILRTRGIAAYVEQTGGGVATIYAGEPYPEEGWGDRYLAIAGPGWFDGPGLQHGRASTTEFCIGFDDDGEGAVFFVPADCTDEQAADHIAAVVGGTDPGDLGGESR